MMKGILMLSLVLLSSAANATGVSADETQKGLARMQDAAQASVKLHEAAVGGDAKAQYEYGLMRANGTGLPVLTPEQVQSQDFSQIKARDPEEARRWFEQSAGQGYAPAQLELGKMLLRSGSPTEKSEAAGWVLKAAEQNDIEAQYILALLYKAGEGVAADAAQSASWFRKAAERGHPSAQFYIGVATRDGLGIPANQMQAASWFRKSAQQGDVRAEQNLGVLLTLGKGFTVEDKADGLVWLRKAADHGNADAQLNLGVRYYRGMDLPKDRTLGLEWMRKAAAQGHADAKSTLASITDSP